jgi:hypothetical protein
VHPDTSHKTCVDYTQRFTLTRAQFDAARSMAELLCGSPPRYHLQTFNCTTFAVRIASAAGQSLPPVSGRVGGGTLNIVADNPNTLYEGLMRRDVGPTLGLTGDSEIRDAIAGADAATVARIPQAERLRIINRLLNGWVSDEDMAAIRTIHRHTPAAQRPAVNRLLEDRAGELGFAQRSELRMMAGG